MSKINLAFARKASTTATAFFLLSSLSLITYLVYNQKKLANVLDKQSSEMRSLSVVSQISTALNQSLITIETQKNGSTPNIESSLLDAKKACNIALEDKELSTSTIKNVCNQVSSIENITILMQKENQDDRQAREERIFAIMKLIKHANIDIKGYAETALKSGNDANAIIYLRNKESILFIALLFSLFSLFILYRKNKKIIEIDRKAKEFEDELNLLKTTDPITHLPNRLAMFIRDDTRHVALFDIQFFSNICRTYEKNISDEILLDFFVRMSNLAMQNHMEAYRYDIDICAIACDSKLMNEKKFIKNILTIHKSMHFYIFDSMLQRIGRVPLRICTGVATFQAEGHAASYSSETALQIAKKNGSGIFVYDSHHHEDTIGPGSYRRIANQALTFYDAYAKDHVQVALQPIADATTLEIIKHEALARIIDMDTGAIIEPGRFIPGVYRLGINNLLTTAMFDKVWEIAKKADVSFNMSITDIECPETCSRIFGLLARDIERAKNITIEIVENEDESKSSKIHHFITLAKQLGCKISIDDFGSGYSNFRRLVSEWRVDYIKIDGSIVSRIETDKNALGIISGIVSIARDSGIKTVAEFVSSESIYNIVKDCGVDYIQGHYVGMAQIWSCDDK